ncbi:short chain dehydrogenase/reductase family protein [Aspergillus heterothallicus]
MTTTTAKRGFLPREGLYVDPIAKALRKSILHPLFTLTLLHLVRSGSIRSLAPYEKLIRITAATSVLLWVNDWLSSMIRNNWVVDSSWDWKKELVVVTGGSSGIGAGVAQQLAAMGARVVVLDISPLTYKPDTQRILYHQCDLSDEKEIAAVCEKIRSDIGNPTVLLNNAGLSRGRTVSEGTYGDNSITLKTNLLAPFLLTKEFLPSMIRQNHGHIFNVASVSAYIPPPGLADYAASKAGLIAFNECLAQELRVQNAPKVRTSLAVLSFTKTPLFKGETNQSQFLMPLLHTDTVVDAIVDVFVSGLSQTIFLPGIFRFTAGLRGAPDWVQDLVRGGAKSLKVDFKGRQKIDPQTGRLVQ